MHVRLILFIIIQIKQCPKISQNGKAQKRRFAAIKISNQTIKINLIVTLILRITIRITVITFLNFGFILLYCRRRSCVRQAFQFVFESNQRDDFCMNSILRARSSMVASR
jgi:hypothetical protein